MIHYISSFSFLMYTLIVYHVLYILHTILLWTSGKNDSKHSDDFVSNARMQCHMTTRTHEYKITLRVHKRIEAYNYQFI